MTSYVVGDREIIEHVRRILSKSGIGAFVMTDKEKVLVLETEQDVRKYCEDALSRLGYEPHATASFRDALDLVLHHAPEYSAIVLGFESSGGGKGIAEIAAKARDCGFDGKVVIASGYDMKSVFEKTKEIGAWYLSKPYLARDLEAAVKGNSLALLEHTFKALNPKL